MALTRTTYTVSSTDGAYVIHAGMAIDADGSPRAYNKANSGLDDLLNAGPLNAPYGYELNPATGHPFVQGLDAPAYSADTQGFYVSSTSYQRREYPANDPSRYLNSETELYIVATRSFRRHIPGVVLGCRATVTYRGQSVTAIVGDIGPDFGEASVAVAKALGINSNARTGGCAHGVEYRIYPGQTVAGYQLQPV